MGKNQHSKDRLYITRTEWKRDWGGKSLDERETHLATRKCLPFDHCALSLSPFVDAVMSPQGHLFDILNIVPYLKKYGTNPVTSEPMLRKELIRVTFHKNARGQYHCPLTFKVFNANSHIVCIAKSGNVYSYEAIKELNIVPKCWIDQVSGETFKKKDIITIQDPHDLSSRVIKKNQKSSVVIEPDADNIEKESEYSGKRLPRSAKRKRGAAMSSRNVPDEDSSTSVSSTLKSAPSLVAKSSMSPSVSDPKQASAKTHSYTLGGCSSSFTSSAVPLMTKTDMATVSDEEARITMYATVAKTKKKGFVRLVTSLGNLNVQLECDLVPFACHNFLLLCKRGYYDGVVFHRNIKQFMIQGGDPTGSGRGGESAWKNPFRDEFLPSLRHDARGVLAMANAGPDSNKSQFYFTYRATRHLDGKHTVFGCVVGGTEVLDAMEAVDIGVNDRPLEPISISNTIIYTDPFQELEDAKAKKVQQIQQAAEQAKKDDTCSYLQYSNAMVSSQVGGNVAVGKYLSTAATVESTSRPARTQTTVKHTKKARTSEYGNFGSW